MSTNSQASVINPGILILGLLAAAVIFIGVTGKRAPVLSNLRVDIAILLVLGMAICAQGGIGRVAAANAWTHPLSIVGYLLGGLILLVAAAAFFGLRLPLIQDDRQALIAIALLAGLKVVNAVLHSLLARV